VSAMQVDDLEESADRKVLTFRVGDEEYGVGVLEVEEVRRLVPVTSVPGTPSYVRGMANLRGMVVPVVDLRARFGREPAPDGRHTILIVVRRGARLVGIVADAFSDVFEPEETGLKERGASVDAAIRALVRRDTRLIALLDVGRVMGLDDEEVPS
jgi:purine-binding chemotaxis protein CheW